MSAAEDDVITRECPACHSAVPAAVFCGSCGADLAGPADRWTILLRPKVFAAAHREPVWLPRITSTMMPRMAGPARKPFRIGLIGVLIAIVLLAEFRVIGPLGVTSTIGWPLLFLIYAWQTDMFRDLPARILITATAIGLALGVAWWLVTGRLVAGTYGLSTGSSLMLLTENVIKVGLLISIGAAVMMLVPAVVTRLFRVPDREAMDGFAVGAFGALWFATASTTTLLAPQFAEGLMKEQTAGRLLEDSITYGIVDPIITTTAGGLVGLLLWFRPDPRLDRSPRRARTAMAATTVFGIACYLAVWIVDAFAIPRALDVMIKIGISVLAILAARFGAQIALLHEAPDPWTGEPILCVHCEHVVPDMPFCCECGVAARASSGSSRRLRHDFPPQPVQAV